MRFHIARDEEILAGKTTDVYFSRTKEILNKYSLQERKVVAEFTTSDLPKNWEWGVFCGLEEVIYLLKGREIDLYSLPEGTIFKPRTFEGIRVPVMVIEGAYGEFCLYETPALGFICQASGIATMAARCKKAAGDKTVIAFGIRRMHPGISPMLDRSSYIGGCDGVSSLIGAELIGEKPTGTMPHALIIVFGDQASAFKAFDETIALDVPRIALVDTYYDEKIEAIIACESVKNLHGVRLDTPKSRKGSYADIIREVRWEMNIRGYEKVKIYISGSVDDENIPDLARAGADGFGVGTSISNAPTIDFAMDIVEMEGKAVAKRGKFGGKKTVYQCSRCFGFSVSYGSAVEKKCPNCGVKMEAALEKYIEKGEVIRKLPAPQEIRARVLEQIKMLR
ncbi:MAG: nicotinate phosphoribosyltransferase [Halobacteria archaeon]